MPKRAATITREYLQQVPLPTHASTYTVIPHETVIVNVKEQLKLKGFKIEDEKYRCNSGGEVAMGIYRLIYGEDPELGMMFAWANSYDKSMRFQCGIGGFVKVSHSSIVSDGVSYSRKHTGTADQEMVDNVKQQIGSADIYFANILEVKEQMKTTAVAKTMIAEFIGKAFIKEGIFSKEQIGVVRDEIIKPSHVYGGNPESLWSYYNCMLLALKKSHPRTWMDEQRTLHRYICQEFNVVSGVVVPPINNIPLSGTVTAYSAISTGDPSMTNGSTGFSTPTSIIEEPIEKAVNMFAETINSPTEVGFMKTKVVPVEEVLEEFSDELSPADRAQIEANIKAAQESKVKTKKTVKKEEPDLNLPD